MKPIEIGTTFQQTFTTEPKHTAASVGNHGVDVVATTTLILFFEDASDNLVRPYYDKDEVTVGTHVNVDHLARANIGTPIIVTAELTRQKGKRLEFKLGAKQDDVLIMSGVHHRAVMPKSRFSKQPLENIQPNGYLDFWFDFHSPWCYFACHRIGQLAKEFNLKINWKPVHLANLIDAIGGRRPLEANKNFVDWYQQDQKDTAHLYGLKYEPHSEYPKRPSRALRAAIYAQEQGLAELFVKTMMTGYWSAQKDISDMQWIQSIGQNLGLSSSTLSDVMTSDEYKEKLNSNLHKAIELKLFGLPTIIFGEKLYWGNDRIDLLREHLKKCL